MLRGSSWASFSIVARTSPVLTPGSDGAVDRGRREHVVADDLDRPGGVADLGHRPQRHHVAVGVADLELLDGLRIHAEGGVGLDVDLPGAAEAVEVVDVVAAQVRLQRVEDVGQLPRPSS